MRYIPYGTVEYGWLPGEHRQVVVVGAFLSDGRVLLVQKPGRKAWELPGGRVASGEKPAAAAARELASRAGVTADAVRCHGAMLWAWRDETVVAHLFSANVPEAGIASAHATLPEPLYFPQHHPWVERLRRERSLQVRELSQGEAPPLNLLLLADPSLEMIQTYLGRSRCFIAERDGHVLGEAVLLQTDGRTLEIANIAVEPTSQGDGVGTQLLLHLLAAAPPAAAPTQPVGPANSSVRQLAFYQRLGFRIAGVERDHFRRLYSEPFMEDGVPCVDQIRLAIEL